MARRRPCVNQRRAFLSRKDSVAERARPHPSPMGCLPKAATSQAPSKRRSLREMWSQARHQFDAHQETNASRYVVPQEREDLWQLVKGPPFGVFELDHQK